MLLRGAWIGAVLLAAAACSTVTDDELFERVGVTRLLLIHPGLVPQSLDGAEDTIQLAEWNATTALLVKDGPDVDLLNGESCLVIDTAAGSPLLDGACVAGTVIEATDDPIEIDLDLVTTMRVMRGEPLVLTEPDHDGDGFRNGAGPDSDNPCAPGAPVGSDCDDNCTLLANGDQADADLDGRGDLCVVLVVSSGVFVPDADGDGVPDSVDNCIWKANPDQNFSDPIGAECEQIAEVQLAGNPTIELRDLPADELLTLDGANSYVVVDFEGSLSCTWEVGVCTLDAGQVKLCGQSSGSAALLGC